jgi:hypothetical protein
MIEGSAFPTNDFMTITSKATWSNPLGMLVGNTPGSSVSVGIQVSGRPLGQQVIPTKLLPVGFISLVLKTPQIYADRRAVTAAYQVRDIFGHSQVFVQDMPSGSPFIMVVSNNATFAQSVIPCMLPDPLSGVGVCTGYLGKSWFSTAEDLIVETSIFTSVKGLGTITSPSAQITLKQQQTFVTKPLTIDVFYVMPLGPVSMGDYVDIPVRANVFTEVIYNWNLTVTYDKTALKYVSFTGSPLFRSCVLTEYGDQDGIHSHISLSTLGIQSFVNTTLLSGQNVDLFAIRFGVLSREIGSMEVNENIVSVYVNYMISNMLQYISFEERASKMDPNGYEFQPLVGGQISILPRGYAGIMAYTSNNEVINTAAITGESVYSKITVLGIVESGSILETDFVTGSSVCTVGQSSENALSIVGIDVNGTVYANPTTAVRRRKLRKLLSSGADTSSNCMVELNRHHLEGSPTATVDVNLATNSSHVLNTTVPMRVWYPSLVNVYVRDPILNRII